MPKKSSTPSTHLSDCTDNVLEILALLLVIGWLLGVVADVTAGGSIHLLLALASAVIAARLLHSRFVS